MRMCVILIKSDIKNIPLLEFKGSQVCLSDNAPMFFSPSAAQMILI